MSSRPAGYAYAVICQSDNCPTPPDHVEVTEIKCVLVKEKTTKRETVEVVPEHWEEAAIK